MERKLNLELVRQETSGSGCYISLPDDYVRRLTTGEHIAQTQALDCMFVVQVEEYCFAVNFALAVRETASSDD